MIQIRRWCCILLVVFAAVSVVAQSGVRYINPATLERNPRYSQMVEISAARVILVSGQTATDKDGKVVGKGDFRAQAQQVMQNIKAAAEAAGASLDDVVKLNSFIVDMPANIAAYREARVQMFGSRREPPASTTVGVAALVNPDLLLEVEAVIVLPEKKTPKK